MSLASSAVSPLDHEHDKDEKEEVKEEEEMEEDDEEENVKNLVENVVDRMGGMVKREERRNIVVMTTE